MNKSRRMLTILAAVMLVLSLSLSACSKKDQPGTPANPNNGNGQIQDETKPPEDAGTEETKQGTGRFVGLMDNHSLEIEVNGEPTAFQMDASISAIAEGMAPNETVEFEYVEKAVSGDDSLKQLVLTKLVKAEQSPSLGELPATKQLEVELEGMKEERTANLAEGKGYALYVFDIFAFDPQSDILSMNYDSNYMVKITKLPSDYNVDALQQEAKEKLSKTGKAEDITGEVMHRFMPDTSVFLQAAGNNLTQQYIVKEMDGQGYAFELNIPQGEPAEGFVPLAYASLNSIVTQ
ncbi:hypothetical protein YSY43_50440 [Paenibacillus sp. YSY-4.3]